MRSTIDAGRAGGLTVALIGVMLLVASPATAQAKSEPRGSQAETKLMALGAGYGHPDGSARVRALQRQLLRAGERPGPIDGLFGPTTEAAVRHFQARQGLAIDGLVGPLTAAALRREAAVIAQGEGYGEPHGSERVRVLQQRLRRAGERPGAIDGRFGPLTEAAVRHFQRHHGLAADGVVGEATGGALTRMAASAPERRPRASEAQGPTANPGPGARAEPKPTLEPEPARAGKRAPAGGPEISGPELPGSWAVVAVATALALLLAGALGLVLGQRRRRLYAGAHGDYALYAGSLRPQPSIPGRLASELRRPAVPPASRPDGRRATDDPADASRDPRDPSVLGYASVSGPADNVNGRELKNQVEVIAAECERRGLELIDLVRDGEPRNGKAIERVSLAATLGRIFAGEARGLVVSELSRLTRSAAELGRILDRLMRSEARLVAVAEGLDTDEPGGRLTVRTLIEVSRWERERLEERTHKGPRAGRLKRRPAVADNPELRERIVQMRDGGMTLQAIADRLNDEGVPTVRGGAKWRPSSVRAGLSDKRRLPSTIDSSRQEESQRKEHQGSSRPA